MRSFGPFLFSTAAATDLAVSEPQVLEVSSDESFYVNLCNAVKSQYPSNNYFQFKHLNFFNRVMIPLSKVSRSYLIKDIEVVPQTTTNPNGAVIVDFNYTVNLTEVAIALFMGWVWVEATGFNNETGVFAGINNKGRVGDYFGIGGGATSYDMRLPSDPVPQGRSSFTQPISASTPRRGGGGGTGVTDQITSVSSRVKIFLQYLSQYPNNFMLTLLQETQTHPLLGTTYDYYFTGEEIDQALVAGRYGGNGNSETPTILIANETTYNPELYQVEFGSAQLAENSNGERYGGELIRRSIFEAFKTAFLSTKVLELAYQKNPSSSLLQLRDDAKKLKDLLLDHKLKRQFHIQRSQMADNEDVGIKRPLNVLRFFDPRYRGRNYGVYLKKFAYPYTSGDQYETYILPINYPIPLASFLSLLRPVGTRSSHPRHPKFRGVPMRHHDHSPTNYSVMEHNSSMATEINKIAPLPQSELWP